MSTTPRCIWEPAHRFFRWHIGRRLDLRVEGLEHVPRSGAAMLAARHYHHYWDGAIFAATFERPIHIIVGLDWMTRGLGRRALEALCRAADFPIILRTGGDVNSPEADRSRPPVDLAEARRYLRRAAAETVDLLRAGELVIVFPEGYPTVDPHGTRKRDADIFLPFQHGFVQLVEQAQRDGTTHVPIIPVGFWYEPLGPKDRRWRAGVRFGAPIFSEMGRDRAAVVDRVEEEVRALSVPPARGGTPD